jgi:hypothetical protein
MSRGTASYDMLCRIQTVLLGLSFPDKRGCIEVYWWIILSNFFPIHLSIVAFKWNIRFHYIIIQPTHLIQVTFQLFLFQYILHQKLTRLSAQIYKDKKMSGPTAAWLLLPSTKVTQQKLYSSTLSINSFIHSDRHWLLHEPLYERGCLFSLSLGCRPLGFNKIILRARKQWSATEM